MVTQKIREGFQKSIDELEAAMMKPLKQTNQSGNARFEKAFTQTVKELRESAGKVILKKAMEAAKRGDLSFHQVEKLAGRLKKGEKIPDDSLRYLGLNVPGKATRREAIAAMEKALDRGEITLREFSIGEDELNRGVESPVNILKALATRRKNNDESERLAKSNKEVREKDSSGVESRLCKSNDIELAAFFNGRLTSEQEIFLRQFPTVGPRMASMIAKSYGQRE